MNNIVVNVNGEDITEQLLEGAVTRYIIQLEEDEETDFEPSKENMKFIKTEVLNRLIERVLLLQKAAVEGVEIQHDAVRVNIDKMKANFGTDEEWKDNLKSLHVPEENLFDEIKKDMMIEKLLGDRYMAEINFNESDMTEYYRKNESLMKEPDLFSFYEIYCNNPEKVKQAYEIVQNSTDINRITEELEKACLNFHNHTDIPSYQLPEEVHNVLKDLENGKIGTMQAPDNGILLYKLNGKIIGKKLIYDDIKERLAQYLIQNAKAEIADKLIKEEMDKAEIKYINTSILEN